MKKVLPFVFLCTAFLPRCQNTSKKNKSEFSASDTSRTILPVVFVVKDSSLLKEEGTNMNFYYHDSLFHGHAVYVNKPETKVTIPGPLFLLHADSLQIPYYICPGDHIFITKGDRGGILFSIEGDSIRNNETMLVNSLVKNNGILYGSIWQAARTKKSKDASEVVVVEKDILSRKEKRMQFIDSFSRYHKISAAFKNLALDLVTNASINDELLLLWKNKALLKEKKSFENSIHQWVQILNNEDTNSFNYMYYYALNNAVSIATTSFIDNQISDSADYNKKFDFIIKNFFGKAKDFLLSSITGQAFDLKIPISNACLKQYYAQCGNNAYKKLITAKISQKLAQNAFASGGSKLAPANAGAFADLQNIIFKYRGKLILLDFWASWCGPCRHEIPFVNQLKKDYTGKDIVFLYISTEEDKKDWMNANINEGLDAAHSYLLLDADASPFVKQHNIHSIPRYILIDKNGKIIDADAPRPSETALKKLIDKYL